MICSRERKVQFYYDYTFLKVKVLINTYYKLKLYMEGRECIYKVSLSIAHIMT